MATNFLTEGMEAPDFTGTTWDGKKVRLSDFRGYSVWLIFYRYPGCPLCNLHISALRRRYEAYYKRDLRIIAVFESPREKFPKNIGGKDYPKFPMIADPKKEIYRLYGTQSKLSAVVKPGAGVQFLKAIFSGFGQGKIEGELGQIPAHFLIGEGGFIEDIYFGSHIGDHIPFEDVDTFLQRNNIGNWQTSAIL